MSWSGLDNTFRKDDAYDVIVPEMPWADIQNKPADLDSLIAKIAGMVDAVAANGTLLTDADTLRKVKDAVNRLILQPLQITVPEGQTTTYAEEVSRIPIDGEWNFITQKPKDAELFARAVQAIGKELHNYTFLSRTDTMRVVKGVVNNAIIKALEGLRQAGAA